jgi:hypothetical protein
MSISTTSRRRPLARARLLAAGMAIVALGGCSIFVPHVKPRPLLAHDPFRAECAATTGSDITLPAPKLKKGDAGLNEAELKVLKDRIAKSKSAALESAGGVDPSLLGTKVCEGYVRAEEYRRDYYDAIRWNSGLKNTITALMIPLAGLAAREGFDANPSNAKIEDFSIGGIVLYGWATALTSAPRQKVYFNGMQAMSCAMIEAQPIMVGSAELGPLNDLVKSVKEKRKAFRAAITGNKLDALDQPADAKYLKVLSDAENSIGKVVEYSVQLNQASGQFLPFVETLATQVGRNIVDTEPSNESLLTLIGGFGSQARTLVSSALPPKISAADSTGNKGVPAQAAHAAVDPRKAAEAAIAPAYLALREAIDNLNDMMSKVAAVSNVATKLQACKADPVVNEFKVDPSDASVVIKEGETREFTVTNKISVPSVSVEGENADHVERQDTLVRDQSFIVRVKGVTKTGDAGPTLVIKDGTGQQERRIGLKISAADAANTPPPPKTPAASDPSLQAAERALILNKALVDEVSGEKEDDTVKRSVKALQCALKITPITGTVAEITRGKIKEFMKDVAGRNPADGIDAAFLDKVKPVIAADASCKSQTP